VSPFLCGALNPAPVSRAGFSFRSFQSCCFSSVGESPPQYFTVQLRGRGPLGILRAYNFFQFGPFSFASARYETLLQCETRRFLLIFFRAIDDLPGWRHQEKDETPSPLSRWQDLIA